MATTANSGSGEAAAATNGVYTPVATLAKPYREASDSPKTRPCDPAPSEGGASHSEGGGRSHSPATSSSTHTTTASPAY